MSIEERLERIEVLLAQIAKDKNVIPALAGMISVEEAASKAGLSKRTIQNLISNGKIRVNTKKVGQKLMLNQDQFAQWLTERIISTRT
jgi:excisionase family DNA binding protein